MKRRAFIRRAAATPALLVGSSAGASSAVTAEAAPADAATMRDLVAFTRGSFTTSNPTPFGAAIAASDSGALLVRRLNEVGPRIDPTCHGEVNTVRAACRKLKRLRLAGYTLYTTGEPCPMCAAAIVFAGLDRMVFGATIADIGAYMPQIRISAADVVARGDGACRVTGPVERDACLVLFADPALQKVFARWREQ